VTFASANVSSTVATLSSAGVYTLRLTASDGTNSVSDDVTVTLNPEPRQNAASFEAETGIITGPFVVAGGAVSQSVQTGIADGGRAVYTFTVPEYGNYFIAAYLDAPNDGANSLFVAVDAEPADPFHIWDIPLTSGFESRVLAWRGGGTSEAGEFAPKLFALDAGQHSLVIIGREAGVSMDRFEVYPAGPEAPKPPSGLRVVAGL
jgi:hypothetical protein